MRNYKVRGRFCTFSKQMSNIEITSKLRADHCNSPKLTLTVRERRDSKTVAPKQKIPFSGLKAWTWSRSTLTLSYLKNPNLVMANVSLITLISLLSIIGHSLSLENPVDDRILVVLDDWALKSSHSIFFDSLQKRGCDLDFKLATDKIALQRYGQYLYDALILFCPTSDRKLYI